MNDQQIRSTLIYKSVVSLAASVGLEYSFRISPGNVRSNRFLLMTSVASIPHDASGGLSALLRTLNMPTSQLDQISMLCSAAKFVHFGFEGGTNPGVDDIYKVYFEVQLEPDPNSDPDGVAPTLSHVALKWSPNNAQQVGTAHYYAPRQTTDEAIIDRAEEFGNGEIPVRVGKTIARLLRLAIDRAPTSVRGAALFKYLQVIEQGHPRTSYAVTLYQAQLSMSEAWGHIETLCELLEVSPNDLPAASTIGSQTLGNIAAGIHRSGEPFVTLYYGAKSER